jgi:molybdopterin-guanine dinucleotide biosynthesis protein A
VNGYVLCGGRSTRMGRDKAFVEIDGRPLALRVADAFAVDRVLVVGRPEQGLERLGLPVVHDRAAAFQHPLLGVEAALEHAGEAALLAPCDLGWLDRESVERLLAATPPVVASDGTRLHPLLGVLTPELLPAVRSIVERQGSVHELARACGSVVLPAAALRNVNAVEDMDASPDKGYPKAR